MASEVDESHVSWRHMREDQKKAIARAARKLDRPGFRPLLSWGASAGLSVKNRNLTRVRHRAGHWEHHLGRNFAVAAPNVLLRGPSEWMADFEWMWLHDYVPKTGDVVVDVGAGIGTEVYPLSKLVGETGLVIGIEAFPPVADCLAWTVRANGLTNVRLHNVAASDKAGSVKLSDSVDAHEHNSILANDLYLPPDQTCSVPADTLDSLLADVPHIAWLKMNIEGAERPALLGAKEVLGRTDHLVVSCHDFIADVGGPDELRTAEFVTNLLQQHGFKVFRQPEQPWWRRDEIWGDRAS